MSNNTIFDGVDLGYYIDNETLQELRKDYVKARKEYYQDAAKAGLSKRDAMKLRKLATRAHILDLAACNRQLTETEQTEGSRINEEVYWILQNYVITRTVQYGLNTQEVLSPQGANNLEFNSDPRGAPFRFRLNNVTVVPAYFPV